MYLQFYSQNYCLFKHADYASTLTHEGTMSPKLSIECTTRKKASEYDQEMPQSHSTHQTMAP